jgi:hypothetical protein
VAALSPNLRAYVDRIVRAGKDAVPALAAGAKVPRVAAADAFAATAALVVAGLARHRARRGGVEAAAAVLAKFGRPADVDAPALAVAAHLSRQDLDPRLGGLLGDAGTAAVAWLAGRTGAPAVALGRIVAATAPMALGALAAAAPADGLDALLAEVGPGGVDSPASLADAPGAAGAVFERVRKGVSPFWRRWARR